MPKMRASAGMLLSATVGMRRLPSAVMPARKTAAKHPVSVWYTKPVLMPTMTITSQSCLCTYAWQLQQKRESVICA